MSVADELKAALADFYGEPNTDRWLEKRDQVHARLEDLLMQLIALQYEIMILRRCHEKDKIGS